MEGVAIVCGLKWQHQDGLKNIPHLQNNVHKLLVPPKRR